MLSISRLLCRNCPSRCLECLQCCHSHSNHSEGKPTEDEQMTSDTHIEVNVVSGNDAQQRRQTNGEPQALDESAEQASRSVSAMHTASSLTCVIAPMRAQRQPPLQ